MDEPMVVAENLAYRYGDKVALYDVNFAVQTGRVLGIIGPEGAGKSTLLYLLAGILRPGKGSVRIGAFVAVDLAAKLLTGYAPAVPVFYPHLTALEYLAFFGRLTGMGEKEAAKRGTDLLKWTGLTAFRDKRPVGFSMGMKRKLSLAQALIAYPQVLLLDELLTDLPLSARENLIQLIRMEVESRQTTVVFTGQTLDFQEEWVDDVLVLQQGRVLLSGNREEVGAYFGQDMYIIQTSDNDLLWDVLQRLNYLSGVAFGKEGELAVLTSQSEKFQADLFSFLSSLDLELTFFQREKNIQENLRRYFWKGV